MTIRAERDPSFYRRFWLMAIGALAFGLYCVYDGAVAYPNQRERALKYREFKEKAVETNQGDWIKQWRAYAKQQGWPTSDPGEPKNETDFQVQFAMAGLCGVVALVLLGKVVLSLGMWIEADDSSIKTSWGKTVPFAAIERVNKKDWQKKGLARIYYADEGRTRKFVLDNFKFHREPTDQIMRRIEEHISEDQIVDGPSEIAIEREKAVAAPKQTAEA